jgi:tektin-4
MLTSCIMLAQLDIKKRNIFFYYKNKKVKFICFFFQSQSTPESWAQNSHDNIVAAENERMASIQMRELINNIIQDTSRDMREQADRVENAFAKRIEEMAGAKAKMENQLENVTYLFLKKKKNF